MIEQTIKCDCGCGQIKKQTNHWTMMRKTSNSVQFIEWDENLALNDEGIEHFAGDACCQKRLSQWLTARKHRDEKEIRQRTEESRMSEPVPPGIYQHNPDNSSLLDNGASEIPVGSGSGGTSDSDIDDILF